MSDKHDNAIDYHTTDENVILKHKINSGILTSEIVDKNSEQLIAPIHFKYPEKTGSYNKLGIKSENFISAEVIHEGSVVRLYQWNDKTYLSTFRRYDGSLSHWNDSESFEDIVKRCLNISSLDQWFENEANKGYAFMFTLVHPKLRGVSKNILPEYLLLIKVVDQNDGSKISLNKFTKEITPFPYKDLLSGKLLTLEEKCYVDIQSKMSNHEADDFLHYGFMLPYKNSIQNINTLNGKRNLNPVLLPGEQLLIKYLDKNANRKTFKLLSPSMNWRKTIRANTFNFTARLWDLSTYAKVNRKDFDYNQIRELFFTQLSYKNIQISENKVAIPFITNTDIKYNFYSIMDVIFKNLLMSASVEDQDKVRNLINEFYQQQTDLQKYLEDFIPKVNNGTIESNNIPGYLQQFIEGCNRIKNKRTSMSLSKIISKRISMTSGKVLFSIYRYLQIN